METRMINQLFTLVIIFMKLNTVVRSYGSYTSLDLIFENT